MATTSFDRRFYISENNMDTFVKVVTEPIESKAEEKFQSRSINGEELSRRLKRAKKKND